MKNVSRYDWFWIVTAEIEKEYREVLARPKFNVPDGIQLSWRAFIEEVTVQVEPSSHPAFPRDPKDEIFIAAALASDADYLITGDKDLLDEQPLDSTQILRPAEFARLFAIA
jgi:putative PIN family toxin of toxin-antitoxin system